MPRKRPQTETFPSVHHGNMIQDYRRYQRLSKSVGAPSVREKIITEEAPQKIKASNFGDPCAFHRESLDFYCSTHKEPACIICATTMHKVCNVVTVTDTAAKSSHVCVNFEDMEQTIETVIENIEKIKYDREENAKKLVLQKSSIEKELHSIRKKMNERLDRIEKDISTQLKENFRRYKTDMECLIKDMDYRKQCLHSLHNSLIKAKNMDTDVEAFMEEKKIEKKVLHEEKIVSSFYNDEAIKLVDIEFKLNPLINSFLVDIKSFGDINVRKSQSRVNLTRVIHKQSAQEILTTNRHVSHIKIRMKEKTFISTGVQDIRALPRIHGSLQRQPTM